LAPAVADPPRKKPKPRKPAEPRPWWGDGAAPHEQWPGVSLTFDVAWVASRDRWESPDGQYYFDMLEADRACDFFPTFLSHHIGEFAGRPFDLLDYQKKLLIRPLFGWKQKADGLRRFRKVFAFIPKGSGKSPVASGVGLYLLFCDQESAAEVYAVASDRNQARIVHDNAKIMVEESPDLFGMAEVLRDSICYHATRSVYQVLSADAASAHGKRPHGLIFDEFHAQKDRDLYEALKKSMPKRRQPVLMMITHAGDNDEGICFEEYEYAKDILNSRKQDDTCLPVIFEAQNGDDWTDQELWKRVNPGHGVTIQHDGIVIECREAQNEPRKLNDFLRYHLNRWVNSATAWIPIDWWDACEPVPIPNYQDWLTAQTPELALLPCAAGLDLAQKIDLACFAVVFRHRIDTAAMNVEIVDEDEGRIVKKMVSLNYRLTVVPYFWIPEDTMLEHEKVDGVPYSHWKAAGLITVTDGPTIDYNRIYDDITTKILPAFPRLKQGFVGYDPAFATDIASELRDRAGLKVEEILQNYKYMSEACYISEALIKAKHVSHGGHRVLRNHWENVSVKADDARRIRPVKPKKASKHIDGVVSTLMGIKSLAKVPDQKKGVRMFFMGGQHAPTP
jgi:phage terminase large subunit-like protein